MKILMVAPEPILVPRGTPISVYQRLRGLVKIGHEVDLLTYHLGDDIDLDGVTVHRIPNIRFIKHVKAGPSWPKLLLDIQLFVCLVIRVMRERYDVIHSHEEAAFMVTPLAGLFNIHHVYDMHSNLPRQLDSYEFCNYWPITSLFRLLERWTLNSCSAVITVAKDLEQRVSEINPLLYQQKIDNLPLQAFLTPATDSDVNALRQSLSISDAKVIVYTGNFERFQGIDLLLMSTAYVVSTHPETHLVIVGGSPAEIQQKRALAAQHGIESHVFFAGTIPQNKIDAYLKLADILVSPRLEGTSVPLKLYSYLAAGKPIVATKVESHTEILTDEVAVLCDPTPTALTAGMIRLLDSSLLRKQLGHASSELANSRFTESEYLTKLECLYLSLGKTAPQINERTV